ncbi:hypothetical protein [Oceanicoccus sagamiensis]|uniref:PEP-CTERM protein-sorting domain-containing protein n=1 Tax=Oceanicoccus sagamiensis TaxID=716816 RepID=A0A1X9NJQ6_9GAMM|nr:hypothetical protein [Oceanicoccus sagamiensis]ARN75699.1 hypothetical protein BST96_17245 [Oceanicoccus sagamiensis]
MKKLNTILAASALVLTAGAAQAAYLPLAGTISGTSTGFDAGTTTGTATGIFQLNTLTLSWQATTNVVTGFTNMTIESTTVFNVFGVGETRVDSCTNNGGAFNGCLSTSIGTWSAVSGMTFTSAPNTMPITLNQTSSVEALPGSIINNDTDYTFVAAGPAVVPVPAAAWLFGSALVGLAGIGRKRK